MQTQALSCMGWPQSRANYCDGTTWLKSAYWCRYNAMVPTAPVISLAVRKLAARQLKTCVLCKLLSMDQGEFTVIVQRSSLCLCIKTAFGCVHELTVCCLGVCLWLCRSFCVLLLVRQYVLRCVCETIRCSLSFLHGCRSALHCIKTCFCVFIQLPSVVEWSRI